MTRFDDYTAAAADGATELDWRHDLIDPDGQLLATTDPTEAESNDVVQWGASLAPLSFTNDRVSQRTAVLSVAAGDLDLVPIGSGSMLHPMAGNRVRSFMGLNTSGGWVWWPRATMIADTTTADLDSGSVAFTINLVDALRPIRSDFDAAFSFDDDETVEAVVTRIVEQVIPQSFTIGATGCVMPRGSLDAGTERYRAANLMLEGCGHELVANPNGEISSRPIPSSADDLSVQRWTYGTGGIPVHSAQRIWSVRRPQGWRIEGGSVQTTSSAVTILVYDTDPSSDGFFSGPGEVRLPTGRYPYVLSVPQAAEAGYGQLRRHGSGPMLLDIEVAPNPALRQGDLMTLTIPELRVAGSFRVLGFTLPLELTDHQTVTVRKVYDPALNYEPPLDAGEGCLVTVTDTFDRADQNLENTEVEAGSADWTEIGYSWAVINQLAIQRYWGGWSLAYCNTPLCNTNQRVTIDIHEVPAGRYVGPAIRSSGQFDCYTALVNSSGWVSLEVWQAGARIATIGSHNSGQSPDGKSLSIEAVGTSITVKLQGTTIITASDDRRTGPHVGMLGFGGSPATAPKVSSFTAEAA